MPLVVKEMLDRLARFLPPPPALPPVIPGANVTLERAGDKAAGLGNLRGADTSGLGPLLLRSGRLDARVRFQLWGHGPTQVDDAMLALHTALLADRDELRSLGFLTLNAAETGLAEPVDTANAWRKTTGVDVLYEFAVDADDDANALISRIDLTTGEDTGREHETITGDLVRWDDEVARPLRVAGRRAVHRLSALAFVSTLPGNALGGAVALRRTSGTGAPPIPQPDLATFLAAAAGAAPTAPDAELTLPPTQLLTQLGATTRTLALGDFDGDGLPDAYASFDRTLDPAIELRSPAEHLEIRYQPPVPPPAGEGPALNATAVIYLRIDQP